MSRHVDDLRRVANLRRNDRITIAKDDVLALLDDYAALEARLAELEKDAARYRVVRARIIPENLYFDLPTDESVEAEEISRTVDSAIDEYLSRAT